MQIKDKVVIVTGASHGIGASVAHRLAAKGATLAVAARTAHELKEFEGWYPGSLAVPTDMSKPEDVHNLIEQVHAKFGRIDLLINNAGESLCASIEDTNIDDFRATMELHVFSVLLAMQKTIPIMRKQGGGMILNVSSADLSKGFAAYNSTKHALNTISLAAREELAKDNIIVSLFYPRWTYTYFGWHGRGYLYTLDPHDPTLGLVVDAAGGVATRIIEQIESEEAEVRMEGPRQFR